MISADPIHDIHVATAPDASHAKLRIPAGFPRDMATVSYCRGVLQAAGVVVTEQVNAALDRLLSSLPPIGKEVEAIIARRIDAVHGKDAQVKWVVPSEAAGVSQTALQSVATDNSSPAGTKAEFDYYNCSAYTMVKKGDIVGYIIPAGSGTDGCDLTGRAIKAKAGKPANIQLDETILCDAHGRLIAQIDGVLRQTHAHVKVDPVLEIETYVDFSTGNVKFDGDVLVRQGVRACFTVKATGNVEVGGLIESTTIECGGTLTSRGGYCRSRTGKGCDRQKSDRPISRQCNRRDNG